MSRCSPASNHLPNANQQHTACSPGCPGHAKQPSTISPTLWVERNDIRPIITEWDILKKGNQKKVTKKDIKLTSTYYGPKKMFVIIKKIPE